MSTMMGIFIVVVLGIIASIILTCLYNILVMGSSPTQDNRCRGGHDF